MASQQARRDSVADEPKIEVEKDRVPKMTSHFESLAVKKSSDAPHAGLTSGNQEKAAAQPRYREPGIEAAAGTSGPQGLSLEDISNLRATAQHNSIDAIRAAQERYQKAKQAEEETQYKGQPEKAKEAEGHSVGGVVAGVKDQAVVAMEKVAEATKTVAGVTSNVAGYTKDKVIGAGQTVTGYAGEKLAVAKDAVVATREKAVGYAARKKEEARRDSVEEQEGESVEEQHQQNEEEKEVLTGDDETGEEEKEEEEEGRQAGGSTVLQAIGETIVEIGQTARDLIAGKQEAEHKEEMKKA